MKKAKAKVGTLKHPELQRVVAWRGGAPFHVVLKTPEGLYLDAEGFAAEQELAERWDSRPCQCGCPPGPISFQPLMDGSRFRRWTG